MGGVESAVPRVASSNDPYQHEQRFLLTRTQAVAFFAAVARHTKAETYDAGRPVSYTRTSYFDTDALDYFHSCAGPDASRLRVREYASASSLEDTPILSALAFLELKTNNGSERTKFRITAASATLRLLIQRRELPFSEHGGVTLDGDLETLRRALTAPTLAPRLTTWYRRTCLSAEDRRVRITYDENLSFCHPRPVARLGTDIGIEVAPRPNDVVAAGPPRILEVKYWGELPDWVASPLKDLKEAPHFSKFRMGMMALGRKALVPSHESGDKDRATTGFAATARHA
jgi:SPX domain protein involved in polyphosphate accumulation